MDWTTIHCVPVLASVRTVEFSYKWLSIFIHIIYIMIIVYLNVELFVDA